MLPPGAFRLGFSWVSQGTSGRRGGGWLPPSEGAAGRTFSGGATALVRK